MLLSPGNFSGKFKSAVVSVQDVMSKEQFDEDDTLQFRQMNSKSRLFRLVDFTKFVLIGSFGTAMRAGMRKLLCLITNPTERAWVVRDEDFLQYCCVHTADGATGRRPVASDDRATLEQLRVLPVRVETGAHVDREPVQGDLSISAHVMTLFTQSLGTIPATNGDAIGKVILYNQIPYACVAHRTSTGRWYIEECLPCTTALEARVYLDAALHSIELVKREQEATKREQEATKREQEATKRDEELTKRTREDTASHQARAKLQRREEAAASHAKVIAHRVALCHPFNSPAYLSTLEDHLFKQRTTRRPPTHTTNAPNPPSTPTTLPDPDGLGPTIMGKEAEYMAMRCVTKGKSRTLLTIARAIQPLHPHISVRHILATVTTLLECVPSLRGTVTETMATPDCVLTYGVVSGKHVDGF